jgi:hypothetical protein
MTVRTSYPLSKKAQMNKALNPLQALQDLFDQGSQPSCRTMWLGLDFLPEKQNAIEILPACLPTDVQCRAVCGLDVILLIKGFETRYGILIRLCGSLYQARPRRLQVHDLDYQKTAYLKLGGRI